MTRSEIKTYTFYHLLVICTLIVFFTPSLSASGAEKKVEQREILVIGTGPIVNGNVAKAKALALSEALNRGIESYLTMKLTGGEMINNFRRLMSEVVPSAADQVENFNILTEEQTKEHYKILVRVKINEKMMEERLREIGLILMEGPPIKVLFMVSHSEPDKNRVSFWWNDPDNNPDLNPAELVLHRIFQERGFIAINRSLNFPEEEIPFEMQGLELDDESVIWWGNTYSADVVIYGRTEIVEGRDVSVEIKALEVERGITLYQDYRITSVEEDPENVEPPFLAIQRVVKKIAVDMGPAIITATEVPETEITLLDISLKGLRSFKQFRVVSDFFTREIKGVKSVKQTRAGRDSISISVEYSGQGAQFLELVSESKNAPFIIELIESEGREIVFNIR